ncbi:MAG: efflux RND transporter permease subunit [Cyanobacteria bacterium REEB67]|nr:efflux RND transporter permease subunit [Cyanobacteria bacterium REEB67]
MTKHLGLAGNIAKAFINTKLTPLIIVASVLLGIFAVMLLPREEEPQIIVPVVDIFVALPGSSAQEVEQRVSRPLENLLWQIPGVEYVYSTSSTGKALVVVRFRVGENEEKSIIRLNQKMAANFDLIPAGASKPLIKPRSIDDVPILALTLSGPGYSHYTLRRLAAELRDQIDQINDVSEVKIIGGQRRQLRVVLDAQKLIAYHLAPDAVIAALNAENQQAQAGAFEQGNREFTLQVGEFIQSEEEAGKLVVGVYNDQPVKLEQVARIVDGPEEPANYVFVGFGPSRKESKTLPGGPKNQLAGNAQQALPAVTISVAKRKGTNAAFLSEQILEKVRTTRGTIIPADVTVTISRNYGETATEKSNELLWHMLLAVVSVSLLIFFALGFRESLIVAIAIPVTLALTLLVFYLYGFTINRITLFALIFSVGILVDDAIVVVENITRHYRLPQNQGRALLDVAVEAVAEVGNPTILATFAVIGAILPMAFVGGLMGPYMRPIPVGASSAMLISLMVAFIITPWSALRLLKKPDAEKGGQSDDHETNDDWTTRIYRKVMTPLLHDPRWRYGFLASVVVLLIAAVSLFALQLVVVKMLPFDNKSELQVVIDMPEGSTLEQTLSATREMGTYLASVEEVTDFEMYAGTASPYNFNGLVRHYFLREGSNVADIHVNLLPKEARKAQSHDIAKRIRPFIDAIAKRYGARPKIAESPPGPPVQETLVTEVYGPDYDSQVQLAGQIKDIYEKTPGVVDIDWSVEDDQKKYQFAINKAKAALNDISPESIARNLSVASGGLAVGLLHDPKEKEDVSIFLRLNRDQRSSVDDLLRLKIKGRNGSLVSVDELVRVVETTADKSIFHKNLMPVVYVSGDLAGRTESPVYVILKMGDLVGNIVTRDGFKVTQYTSSMPFSTEKPAIKWDGEWHITYEVFRDMGIAFAVVLVLIYILIVSWFQSFKVPLVIMAAIPFSLVGILPAHWLMGAYFTATSMIGFIAGAGIVVRNSIILIDFVQLKMAEGMPLEEAVVEAGAVRFRPMMLTAAAVVIGASVILFDPIFQGLAISLMAGEVASLLLSRMAVPILYFLSQRRTQKTNDRSQSYDI